MIKARAIASVLFEVLSTVTCAAGSQVFLDIPFLCHLFDSIFLMFVQLILTRVTSNISRQFCFSTGPCGE